MGLVKMGCALLCKSYPIADDTIADLLNTLSFKRTVGAASLPALRVDIYLKNVQVRRHSTYQLPRSGFRNWTLFYTLAINRASGKQPA
jgi:hypothetical protein